MKKRILSLLLAVITILQMFPVFALPTIAEDEVVGIDIADMEVGKLYSAEFIYEYEEFVPQKPSDTSGEEDLLEWKGYDEGVSWDDAYVPMTDFPADLIVKRISETDIYFVYVTNEDWPAEYDEYRYVGIGDIIITGEYVAPPADDGLVYGQVGLVMDGESVETLTIAKGEKTYVFTELGNAIEGTPTYRWQLLIDRENNRWANIQDYVYPYAPISEALIANAGLDGAATLRCIATQDGVSYASGELDVTVDPTLPAPELPLIPEPETEAETETAADAESRNTDSLAVPAGSMARSARAAGEAFQVTIQYVYWNGSSLENSGHGTTALPTYTATVGDAYPPLTTKVRSLSIAGYKPYIRVDSEVAGCRKYAARENPLDPNSPVVEHYYVEAPFIEFFDQKEAYDITVYYLPELVSFTVNHYIQNLNDDEYTPYASDDMQGYSAYPVEDGDVLHKAMEGFTHLFYDPKTPISANGNTIVDIYYDREYYLVDFDLTEPNSKSEGYGVMPMYVRYETPIQVGDPQNPGYTFDGWELDRVYTKTEEIDGDGKVTVTETEIDDNTIKNQYLNPSVGVTVKHNLEYKAIWEVATTTYTVIYWVENANDDAFAVAGYTEVPGATPGAKVNAQDNIPTSVLNSIDAEKAGLVYIDEISDKNVEIKGDGTSSVNVYYKRKLAQISFTVAGTCKLELHTHSDACQATCTLEAHTHSDVCGKGAQTCGKEEHIHIDTCCSVVFHKHGQGDCPCNVEAHTHGENCYHHLLSCYTSKNVDEATGTAVYYANNKIDNPQNGYVYRYRTNSYSYSTYYYLYVNDTWYSLGEGTNNSTISNTYGISFGNLANPGRDSVTSAEANLLESDCSHCGKQSHIHGAATCPCDMAEHDHTSGCQYICDKEAHTHIISCFTYNCGKDEHIHDGSCFRGCTQVEHRSHSSTCNRSTSNNIAYAAMVKYGADTTPWWNEAPTGYRWVYNSSGYTAPPTMPANGIGFTGEKLNATYTYTIHYYEEGTTISIRADSVYYRNSNGYHLNDADYIDIPGFTCLASGNTNADNNLVYRLYYSRNSYDLTFHDGVRAIANRSESILYEADISGKFFIPDTPSGKEKGSVKFAGWYTTPTCADGTEFNFAGQIMPSHDLTLYAKWEPTYWDIVVYQEKPIDGDPLPTVLWEHYDVPFGTLPNALGEEPERVSPIKDYIFAGWYYEEPDGTEKRFDFNTMPIKRDYVIYAKWTSKVPVIFEVRYVTEKDGNIIEIADRTEGKSLAGVAKSFTAKADKELYTEYQTGYFPTEREQTQMMVHKVEDDGKNIITFTYVTNVKIEYQLKHVFVSEDFVDILGTDRIQLIWKSEITETSTESALLKEEFKAKITQPLVVQKLMETYGIANDVATDIWEDEIVHMAPDGFSKSLILCANVPAEENEIVFNWTGLQNITIYEVHHLFEVSDGVYELQGQPHVYNARYEENKYATLPAPVVKTGYDYTGTYTTNNDDGKSLQLKPVNATTDKGLIIYMYYNLKDYSYTVRYIDEKNFQIHQDNVTRTGKYMQKLVVGEIVKDVTIPGYELVNGDAIVTLDSPGKVIDCVYRKQTASYFYRALSGSGRFSISEQLDVPLNEQPDTVEVQPDRGWILKQWYYGDVFGNNLQAITAVGATKDDDGNLTPRAPTVDDVGKDFYFWAEFVPTTLTISGSFAPTPAEPDDCLQNQGFIYHINGKEDTDTAGYSITVALPVGESKSILGLPAGDYTVTVEHAWSWRYPGTNISCTVTENDDSGSWDAGAQKLSFKFDGLAIVEFNFTPPNSDPNKPYGEYFITDEVHN